MRRLIKFPIKGTFHYAAELALDQGLVHPGLELAFKAEPENSYDRYAIQIWIANQNQQTEPDQMHGYLLGYVPRVMSKNLTAILQRQSSTKLTVVHKARLGKRIEIDCMLEIEQAWWPYLYLFAQALFATHTFKLKRFTQGLLNRSLK